MEFRPHRRLAIGFAWALAVLFAGTGACSAYMIFASKWNDPLFPWILIGFVSPPLVLSIVGLGAAIFYLLRERAKKSPPKSDESEPTVGARLERVAFAYCKVATVCLIAGRYALPIAALLAACFFTWAFFSGHKETRCWGRWPLVIAAFWLIILYIWLIVNLLRPAWSWHY